MAINQFSESFESRAQSSVNQLTDASLSLLADANPFAPTQKSGGTEGILVAWNDQPKHDYSQVNQRTDVDTSIGIVDKNYNKNYNSVRGGDQEFHNQNRNVLNGGDQELHNQNTMRGGDQELHNQSTLNGGDQSLRNQTNVQGSSATINQGSTKIDARALGLSRAPVLTNQCSEFAVQLGGGAGFIHGDVGVMKASGNCLDAIKVQADCDGVESISRANLNTTQAEMMWGDREHGVQTTRKLAEITTAKAGECANLEKVNVQTHTPATVPQDAPTRQDMERQERRINEKIDRAFNHTFRK